MDFSFIEKKIKELNVLKEQTMNEIDKRKKEIIHNAISFDTYPELYSFVKKHTNSLEEFNETMLFARDMWLRNKNR